MEPKTGSETGSCSANGSINICSGFKDFRKHLQLGHRTSGESQLGAYFMRYLWGAAAPASQTLIDFARRQKSNSNEVRLAARCSQDPGRQPAPSPRSKSR